MRVFVAIDLMSLVHPLAQAHDTQPIGSPYWERLLRGWINKMAQPPLYLPELSRQPDTYQVVLLADQKDSQGRYWRHDVLRTYKSARRPNSSVVVWCRKRLIELAHEAGLSVLVADGFEADDWAGEMVRAIGKDDRVFLLSVDSDWGQLVSDRVIWLDTYCVVKRKSPEQQGLVMDRRRTIRRFNAYRDNRDFQISNPRDIVDLKWTLGDKSDQIPAGQVPGLRGIIDLISPAKYPVPINLIDLVRPVMLFEGIPDIPLWMLGLPSGTVPDAPGLAPNAWSVSTVNLQTMEVTNDPY